MVGTAYDPSDGNGDAVQLGVPSWPDAVAVIEESNDASVGVAALEVAMVAEIGSTSTVMAPSAVTEAARAADFRGPALAAAGTGPRPMAEQVSGSRGLH